MTKLKLRWQTTRQAGRVLVTLVAWLVFVMAMSSRSFAICDYPDVVKGLGKDLNAEGVRIAVLPGGATSMGFLAATVDALNNLRRTDGALIHSVDLKPADDGVSVEDKFINARRYNGYDAFVV